MKIKDCELAITGRVGGAYSDMKNFGVKVLATDVKSIEEAISLYLDIENRVC